MKQPCLSLEALVLFANGLGTQEDEAHLALCLSCRNAIDEVKRLYDMDESAVRLKKKVKKIMITNICKRLILN